GDLRPPGENRVPPIDPVKHIGQLRRADCNHTVGRRWPDEATALQPLGVKRHADPVMPDDLEQVTSGASKAIKIARLRVAAQRLRTCSASPFMPLRMSVRPTASHTRTPLAAGIIVAPAPRRPTPATPRRTGQHLDTCHRTVSCTGANTGVAPLRNYARSGRHAKGGLRRRGTIIRMVEGPASIGRLPRSPTSKTPQLGT